MGLRYGASRWLSRSPLALSLGAGALAFLWGAAASAGTFPVFGPEDFVRTTGAPTSFTRAFPAAIPGTGYILHIDNGGADHELGPVTSASIKLNNAAVLSSRDFKPNVETIDKPISLSASNVLSISLQGAPGSGITLTILGVDDVAPSIAITAPSEPVIIGNPTPEVTVTYSDARAGVDTATLQIAIDGTALTGCTAGPTSTTCTPPALADGHHTITAQIRDRAGNQGTASFAFDLVLDAEAPFLTSLLPLDGSFVSGSSPGIAANYSDADSGIDLASVRVLVDGMDVTAEAQIEAAIVTFVPTSPLAEGPHTATFRVSDLTGHQAEASTHFSVDTQAPDLAILEPTGATLTETSTVIRVSFSDLTSGIDPASLAIGIDGRDLTTSCNVGAGSAVCSASSLPQGAHTIAVRARDLAGNPADARFSFEIALDGEAPSLAITAPASALVTGNATPEIRIQYSDAESGVDTTTVTVLLDGSDLTSRCQIGPASATCIPNPLERGPHSVTAQIADLDGNVADASLDFVLAFPLAISFTEPEPDFLTGVASVRVTGTVSPTATSVRVNGVTATLGSGTFAIDSLGLHDGVNELVAVATDSAGNVGTASVRVIADTTAPDVGITYPADGTVVSTPTLVVTGLVNDLTIGTVSDTHATVTINGVAASVANRSFAAAGVPLQPGSNTLAAEATDRAGNRATAEVQVTYEPRTGVPTLRIVSGDAQSATISTELPAPLTVEVRDAAGLPMANAQAVFRVARGNGTLEGGERAAVVLTDAQGHAAIRWTIGSRSGVGVDRVRVTAVGVAGEVSFFAIALTGSPAQIDVASGDNQRGAVGSELSRPLFAVVTDAGHNPVPGLPVTFQVVDGSGGLAEGAGGTTVAETDASGLASVRLVLGPSAGFDNNLVEATFAGLLAIPATFKASGFLAGDPAQTLISGVVLDHQGAPVPGVTMRIRDSSLTAATAVTDGQGQFLLTGVPLGQVFLIADATTATRPGHWASLEYEIFAISGVENTLPRPIYILPLDLPNGVFVDETHGGTINLPEVPGFALEIAPGAVTFPGGGRSGVVSVTAVHADRVPMPPGAGMQPRLIVTIQPVGAHFDPPAKFTLPNVDGLTPGTVTEMFSFDHDIGEFVAIGTGTVSEDGLAVRSDPGFGIVEAGWHCGTPPRGSGSTATLQTKITDPPDPTKPLVLSVGQMKEIKAQGEPPLDAAYSWTIVNPPIASLTPTGTAVCSGNTPVSLCPNAAECKTMVKGVAEGETKAKASLKCCVSGQASPDAELTIKVLKIEVKSLGFVGDHQITEWGTDVKIDEPDGTAPVWTRPPAPGSPPGTPAQIKKPVAYTKNAPPRMFAVFTVSPSVTPPITGVMIRAKLGTQVIASASGLTIDGTAINDATNADGDVDDIAGTAAITGADAVKTLTPTFTWEISFDNGATWGPASDSGPHTMHWTETAPLIPPFRDFSGNSYAPLYDRALDKACGYVNGDADISGKITTGVDNDINYDPGELLPDSNPLIVYDSASAGALCGDLAFLLRGLMRSVGVDGTVLFKFGGTNTSTGRRYRRGSTGGIHITFRVLRGAHDDAELNPHFSYHAVVSKGGSLHDPSYGLVYPSLVFDETAFNSTPQQTSTSFPGFVDSTYVCPH